MPGDPKECRQHALNCLQLAKGVSTPEQRDQFAKLAGTWIKLAEELEQSHSVLAAIEDEEPIKPSRLKRKPRRLCSRPGLPLFTRRAKGFAGGEVMELGAYLSAKP